MAIINFICIAKSLKSIMLSGNKNTLLLKYMNYMRTKCPSEINAYFAA